MRNGAVTAFVAFVAAACLAIGRHSPAAYDAGDPRMVFAQRQLDYELGTLMFVAAAFGLFSALYLGARTRRWTQLLRPVRVLDAGVVGFLNIIGIVAISVVAHLHGSKTEMPMLGIALHIVAALIVNVVVYERRFKASNTPN